MSFKLIRCGEDPIEINTSTDLTDFVGSVVQIKNEEGCFTVESSTEESGLIEVEITDCHENCESCLKYVYKLEDCVQNSFAVYSKDEDLEELLGKVVKTFIHPDRCLRVKKVIERSSQDFILNGNHQIIYQTCKDCLPHKHADTVEMKGECEPGLLRKLCSFVKNTLENSLRLRYGMKEIKKNSNFLDKLSFMKWKYQSTYICSPCFEEPVVSLCCLSFYKTPCGCKKSCNDCEEEITDCEKYGCTEEFIEGFCNISDNHDHSCYSYTYVVSDAEVAAAVDNTEPEKNNKVFYAHFPCGKTSVETVIITEGETKTICSVGIPLLGYFYQDKFVNLPYTKEEECCIEQKDCGCE